MKTITHFFWLCAGVSIPLLKRCPTDSSKYAGLGATIFFTGLLAAVSSGYAFYIIFNSYYIAVTLGLVWGLMIFNLDRYIVLSMRKSKQKYKEWIQAVPRLILAILIAIIISKPLEFKIFKAVIDTELSILKQEIVDTNRKAIARKYEFEMDSLNSRINSIKEGLLLKEQKRDELLRIAREEADGTGGSGKVNPGPIYKIKKSNADQVQNELDEMRNNAKVLIQNMNARIAILSSKMDMQKEEIENPNVGGLSFQLLALDRLGVKYPSVWIADWCIILLFICIEISPILTKLISPKGPYDEMLRVREHYYRNYRKEMINRSNVRLDHVLAQ